MTEEDYKQKFPIGSRWKTRGGYVVVIVYHNDHSKTPLVVVSDKMDNAINLSNEGKFAPLFGDNILDLIEPYVEPKRWVGYFNVYDNGIISNYHSTRGMADDMAEKGRIACIRVECTEGQYDE